MPVILTQHMLENRIGAATVKRIYDDARNGSANADAVADILDDAEAKALGVMRGIYSLEEIVAEAPREAVRIMLDIAVAYATQRHPEVVRRDWVPLMAQADADLMKLRKGLSRLDVTGSPEPAANTGGSFSAGDPTAYNAATYKRTFGDGFGSF